MGDSKTFNYPKSNSEQTNSQSHESSRVAPRKPTPNQAQNFARGQKGSSGGAKQS